MAYDETHPNRTHPDRMDGELVPRSRPSRTKVWVIASDDGSCDHPDSDLQRVGSDGINAYYQCARCEAVLVSQDELVRAAQASLERSD